MMTSEKKTTDNLRYQTYEEFRKRFYKSEPDLNEHGGSDGPASFGRRIVHEKMKPSSQRK